MKLGNMMIRNIKITSNEFYFSFFFFFVKIKFTIHLYTSWVRTELGLKNNCNKILA